MNTSELIQLPLSDLLGLARAQAIPAYGRLRKPELQLALMERADSQPDTAFSSGLLEVVADGFGFLRSDRLLPGPDDVYVSQSQIRRFGLRTGDRVTGQVRPPKEAERYHSLLRVELINGLAPDIVSTRPCFEQLTAIFPQAQYQLTTKSHILATRVIDLVAPIGRGQRALIVSPPKAGKTMVLQAIADGISTNYPDVHLLVLLVGERPEEVTEMRRTVKGEVIASTFDESVEDQTTVTEMTLERAKRLVETGQDVVILMDSITRVARAYNLDMPPSGRTLSGGSIPLPCIHPSGSLAQHATWKKVAR